MDYNVDGNGCKTVKFGEIEWVGINFWRLINQWMLHV